MTGLLFDARKLQEHNITKLLARTGKLPKTPDRLGIVFILSSSIVNELTNMSNPKQKISFINSNRFISDIKDIYFVFYNQRKKLIEFRGYTDYLDDILHAVIVYAPRDVTIWTGLIPSRDSELYLEKGFNSPYITDKSPLGYKFPQQGLAFYKKNIPLDKVDLVSSKNILEYIESQRPGEQCVVYAKFTPDAISYLHRLNKPAVTIKNKKIHEKELSGALQVSKVSNVNGKIVFELSGNPETVQSGVEEEVDAVWSRYNFHTHPKKAYVNHGVKNGWPSSQDYLGFIQLKNHTIFHTVVTLEGIYVISFNSEWNGKINKIDHKYVLKHYDVDHKENLTYEQYVDLINNKKYKGGNPLFVVKYIPWDGNTSEIFPVFYFKTGNNCLATDDSFDYHKKFNMKD